MLKKFKNINPPYLITHLLITLAYPAARSFLAERNRLLIFTDTMTILALLLVIAGIIYGFYLRGDYDISGFFLKRGASKDKSLDYNRYKAQQREKRDAAFNYPLFLGILYLALSAFIAYVLL